MDMREIFESVYNEVMALAVQAAEEKGAEVVAAEIGISLQTFHKAVTGIKASQKNIRVATFCKILDYVERLES